MQQLMQVTLEDQKLLLVSFTKTWQQDDIKALADSIFRNIPSARIIERVIGADREYFRFNLDSEYLILHFESYANSCWVESEDQMTGSAITKMYHALNQQHGV